MGEADGLELGEATDDGEAPVVAPDEQPASTTAITASDRAPGKGGLYTGRT